MTAEKKKKKSWVFHRQNFHFNIHHQKSIHLRLGPCLWDLLCQTNLIRPLFLRMRVRNIIRLQKPVERGSLHFFIKLGIIIWRLGLGFGRLCKDSNVLPTGLHGLFMTSFYSSWGVLTFFWIFCLFICALLKWETSFWWPLGNILFCSYLFGVILQFPKSGTNLKKVSKSWESV